MVTGETKKRLLLSKWRTDQESGRNADWYAEQLTETLEQVKYWLHDGIVLHRLVSDPRQLLRKVEDVLG